jgi:broad specificity phosphatase PhoE
MYLLRHGQSYFNLHFGQDRVDPGIEDPELTPLGVTQASEAARRLAAIPLTRIVVSPYLRALQTAEPILAVHPVRVEVLQLVRERAYFACDVGSPPDILADRFPHHDFSHLPTQWWHEGIEPEAITLERANEFRALMAAREDSASTLLVGHWAFIMALTGRSLGNGEFMEYDPQSAAPRFIDWNA